MLGTIQTLHIVFSFASHQTLAPRSQGPSSQSTNGNKDHGKSRMLPTLSVTKDISASFLQISPKGEYLRKT